MIVVTRQHTWILLSASMAILAAGMFLTGITLDLIASWKILGILVAGISLPLWLKPSTDRQSRLIDALEQAAMFSLLSMIGALGSYCVVAGTVGYTDDTLAAMDGALGFDWIAQYRFLAAHRLIAALAKIAYVSIFVTPIMVMFGLGLSGKVERGRQFLMAFSIALMVTLIIFHFFPAQAALAHHLGDRVDYVPAVTTRHIAVIEAARAGTLPPVDPTQLAGIITFPSFHAVAAILFVWAAWPIRAIRWPFALLNGAMLLATPIQGAHYLVDIIGGAAVALLALTSLYIPTYRGRRNDGVRIPWLIH